MNGAPLHKYIASIPLISDDPKYKFLLVEGNELISLDSVNLIISPNNSGKSLLLRQICKYLSMGEGQEFTWDQVRLSNDLVESSGIRKIIDNSILEKIAVPFGNNQELRNKHQYYLQVYLSRFKKGRNEYTPEGIQDYLKRIKNAFSDNNKLQLTQSEVIYKDIDMLTDLLSKDALFYNHNGVSVREDIQKEIQDFLKPHVKEVIMAGKVLSAGIKPDIVYIPNIRTLRKYTNIKQAESNKGAIKIKFVNTNAHISNQTKNEYFLDRHKVKIIDGLRIYDEFFGMRNRTSEDADKLAKYEEFLSINFFKNKPVRFITSTDGDRNKDEIIDPELEDNSKKILKIQVEGEELLEVHKLGDGIQQIIIMTYPLFFYDRAVIFIEEPELNLHAGFEKKFFDLLVDGESNGVKFSDNKMFFIVTHSNHIIERAIEHNKPIFQIQKRQTEGIKEFFIKKVEEEYYDVLSNLGVSASSVLLSNGVIWVEGPSDVIYLRKWFELFQKQYCKDDKEMFKEGLHFTFQVLATSLWSHAGFWSPLIEKRTTYDTDEVNNIINILNVNKNVLLVIDSDHNYETQRKPSDYLRFNNVHGGNKARLIHELNLKRKIDEGKLKESPINKFNGLTTDGKLMFWITDNTMEQYLFKYAKINNIKPYKDWFGENGKIKKTSVKDKVKNAKIIANMENIKNGEDTKNIEISDFAAEDSELYTMLEALYYTIKSWQDYQF